MLIIEIALVAIAACEVVRMIQNAIQLRSLKRDVEQRKSAYAEFVNSLKQSDREFVRRMLEEFEEEGDKHGSELQPDHD